MLEYKHALGDNILRYLSKTLKNFWLYKKIEAILLVVCVYCNFTPHSSFVDVQLRISVACVPFSPGINTYLTGFTM